MKTYCSMILMEALSASGSHGSLRHKEPNMNDSARVSTSPSSYLDQATAVVDFWREAGPSRWFAKDPSFDARFRERFLALHELAARGQLRSWLVTPTGALALMILLDQFPRNAFRGTARMYQTDGLARELADAAIKLGHDQLIDEPLRIFMYLPFGHAEDLADQERSVALSRGLSPDVQAHALGHHDIVQRFGRFPHRNVLLGRSTTAEERQFLEAGGFAG